MANKKYTVIFIPENSSDARRFGIRRGTLWITALSVISLFFLSIILIRDRVSLEMTVARLSPLRNSAKAHRQILDRFGNRMKDIDASLNNLKKMEEQLRIMASVRPRRKGGNIGLGGISKDDLPGRLGGLGFVGAPVCFPVESPVPRSRAAGLQTEARLRRIGRLFQGETDSPVTYALDSAHPRLVYLGFRPPHFSFHKPERISRRHRYRRAAGHAHYRPRGRACDQGGA